MIRFKKVRLILTKEQEALCFKAAGTARFIYNWTLSRQNENHEQGGKFLSDNELRKEITRLKKAEFKWLKEVSSNVPKQAVKDACDAYKKFFKKQSDYPKFKSRKRSKPSFYNDTHALEVKEHSVLIERIGWIKIKKNQIPLTPFKYINPRVSFDGKYWYLSVGFDQEKPVALLTGEIIGIDVGIKDLAVCSNGQIFKSINKSKSVRKKEKKLRMLQRKVSNKYHQNKKGKEYVKTCNIVKLEKQIKLMHRKLSNIRANHLHQATHLIVKAKPSKVVIETLNVSGMMKNKHLSKAIQNQGLYEFKRQLTYKCEWNGIELVLADRWFPSSKLCSDCGNKKKKLPLSVRVYRCECCGLVIDRDYNASLNLSRYTLK